MFVVTVTNNGHKFWLRNTTWAFHLDRATTFATKAEAEAGWAKAKQFTAAKLRKQVKIEELNELERDEVGA